VTNEQLFKENLLKFEEILNKYGYYDPNENILNINLEKNDNYSSIRQTYLNLFIKQKINISCNIWPDGEVLISFYMKETSSDESSFDVIRFLKKRNIENKLQDRCNDIDSFESFVKKYFDDLESLFENELNDQITGKNFENHWQEQIDEFNRDYR
jgi:hypothetical protein